MKKLIILSFGLATYFSFSQTDNILWSSIQLQKAVSEKTILSIKPILRLNNDLRSYQNTSIDIIAKYKFSKGWSIQLLSRSWFKPDQPFQETVFFDVAWQKPIPKVTITNRLRYHWGVNYKDVNAADFFRWITKLSLNSESKLKPYIGVEPWFRLNGVNQFKTIRYEPGINWSISSNYALDLQYRIQEEINQDAKGTIHMIVLNLLYKL